MVKSNTPESPLEATAGVAGPRASDAFELLANETRLAILLALWEAYEPFGTGGGLTFSELRDRVGMRDSGQFNYHLGKLEGEFVQSTDGGYKLRPAGEKITRAVIGGLDSKRRSWTEPNSGFAAPDVTPLQKSSIETAASSSSVASVRVISGKPTNYRRGHCTPGV